MFRWVDQKDGGYHFLVMNAISWLEQRNKIDLKSDDVVFVIIFEDVDADTMHVELRDSMEVWHDIDFAREHTEYFLYTRLLHDLRRYKIKSKKYQITIAEYSEECKTYTRAMTRIIDFDEPR